MNITTFSENIKHLRANENNLSQSEIAVHLDFSVQKWNNYERAKSYPKLEDLEIISKYFGILESDLLHTDIPESDMQELYDRYFDTRNPSFSIGNTPTSKRFFGYLNAKKLAIALRQNSPSVTESVTKPVTKPEKKGIYDMSETTFPDMVLNEPQAIYQATGKGVSKPTESERIARLERILGGVMDILRQELK